MAYRFTNTDKWADSWFSNLKQIEMLLFIYLCDNCDIAGFAEVNIKRWAFDLNSTPDTIEGALKGLGRGLIQSKDGSAVYLRNFLKHQKNLPINPNNNAHKGIIKRFEMYKHKFDIKDITDFITRGTGGANMGLDSPIGNGKGKGNGKDKGGVGEKEPEEKTIDYKELLEFFNTETKGVFSAVRYPISEKRKDSIRARIREHGVEAFREMIQRAAKSNFLKGDNDRGWTATFDWLIKPSNFQKTLEGNYDNRKRSEKNKRSNAEAERVSWVAQQAAEAFGS